MASPAFGSTAAAAFAAVDGQFGEPFLLRPMAPAVDRNAPSIDDVNRAAIQVIGRWLDGVANAQITNAYDPRTDQRPGMRADKPSVKFSPSRIPAGVSIRRGDLLTRLSTGRVWRVSSTLSMRHGTLICEVNEVG